MTATAHAALAGHDWSVLPRLLHPYLHWTGPDGVTIRGRSKVLAMLANQREPAGPPAAVELRDGQIYRWLAWCGSSTCCRSGSAVWPALRRGSR